MWGAGEHCSDSKKTLSGHLQAFNVIAKVISMTTEVLMKRPMLLSSHPTDQAVAEMIKGVVDN